MNNHLRNIPSRIAASDDTILSELYPSFYKRSYRRYCLLTRSTKITEEAVNDIFFRLLNRRDKIKAIDKNYLRDKKVSTILLRGVAEIIKYWDKKQKPIYLFSCERFILKKLAAINEFALPVNKNLQVADFSKKKLYS
jgi:hypothetical protein